MAAASTNGKGNGEDLTSGTPVSSTHESAPGDSEKPDPELDVLSRGSTLGRYLVLERLGAGAMGVVYAAYDPELDRKVAIKILRPHGGGDEDRGARLVREAKAIAKVSHPNVVGIFDVGVHEGQVFLAMEYLAGGTLRDWLAAAKRGWREIVKMFIEVGKGLAGAHAEGLIHRDFKPDNVLVDKNGVPKVVDFGLVRLSASTLDTSISGSFDDPDMAMSATAIPPSSSGGGLTELTRTGALTGTPAYMAAEQFLGKPIDARTDQFAFCVALYEALFGERPFAGKSVIALADEVTSGQVKELVKNVDVPGWVRACILRGLRADPTLRYPSIDDLLSALTNDPIVRRRRRLLVVAAASLAVTGVLTTRHLLVSKRQEIERQVAEHVSLADSALAEAATKRREARTLGNQALVAFDTFERDKGEDLWARRLAAARTADTASQRGIQRLEAAVTLTSRRDLKDRIAEALVAYIQLDGRTDAEREAGLRHLAAYDEGGKRERQLNAPATLRITTTPSGFTARIDRYDPITHRPAEKARDVGRTPFELKLAPGSYRLTFEGSKTHVGFSYPVLLESKEAHAAALPVPPRSAVPKDFVYVPEGRFLFGSADEDVRAVFLETTPLHTVTTPSFLISKYETTIGEWIAFLNSLPPKEQDLRRPQGKRELVGGFMDLRRTELGGWEIFFRAADKLFHAVEGQPLRYSERERRAVQDWSRFPVAAISAQDALAFAAWLNATGRVPGARLCTEREWERAARGADERKFPHGDQLLGDDLNFDRTYGRKSGGYGPDEVGSHPASLSPFGVWDLTGNVWEMTSSVLDKGQFVIRGGSFYQNTSTMLTPNRNPIGSVTRDHTVGLRICADAKF